MRKRIFLFGPFLLFLFLTLIFFYQTLLFGKIPLPSDLIVGGYYPWLDYKWGTQLGVGVKNSFLSDVVSVLYPLKVYAVDLIKSGQLPLWNSKMFAGYPLLANLQLGLFFPTMIFYLVMPSIWAWTIQVMTQPLLACIFMYIFLRHLKLSNFSSIFGALSYGFGGYMMIWLEWNVLALTGAFLPLLLFITDKMLAGRDRRWAVLFSVTLTLQIFTGYLQVVVYSLMAVFLWFIFRKFSFQNLFFLGFFSILGIGISSILLFPSFELFLNSQRKDEILGLDLAFLPYQNLVAFFAPDYFGNPSTHNFWGAGNYTYISIYSGLITFFLATFSIFTRYKEKIVLFLTLLLALSLLIMLENFISKFLYLNGLWGGSAASAIRAAFLVNFSLAALAAVTLDKININHKSFTRFILFNTVLVFTIFIVTFSANQIFSNNNLNISIRNLIPPLALSAIISLTTVLFFKLRKIEVLKYIFFVLLIAELFRFGLKFNTFSKIEYLFPKTPIFSYLGTKKDERIVGMGTVPANMWVPYRLSSVAGYDAVYPKNIATYIAVLNSSEVKATSTRFGLVENSNSPLFDLTSTKYLAVLKKKGDTVTEEGIIEERFNNSKFQKVFEDKSVAILENLESIPRAYIVKRTVLSKGRDVFSKLLDETFDYKNIAVVENKEIIFNGEGKILPLQLEEVSSNHFQITGEIPNDSLVVVTNTFYPGWKAYADKKDMDVYPINLAFMGIYVKEQINKIDLFYKPFSLKIGIFITSVSSLIALLIIVIPRKTREKQNESS